MKREHRDGTGRHASDHPAVHGFARAGFEAVRDAFVENFTRRHELGGACCIYQHGEKVVDLWGGARNKATGEPWEEDTMVVVFSATKGLTAMAMAVAHSRGWLDYDERIASYWPEFAQEGKDQITVRQLLAHQAASWPFGHSGAFGSPGAGGSLGFAVPQTGMAYAYVTNRLGGVTGDARDLALRNAIPQGASGTTGKAAAA
jgi:CubicO group peptidase (beta-lactamase class C family)